MVSTRSKAKADTSNSLKRKEPTGSKTASRSEEIPKKVAAKKIGKTSSKKGAKVNEKTTQPATILSVKEVMRISVTNGNSDKIDIEVEGSDTIKSVMEKCPKGDKCLDELLFNGARLEEDKTVSDYEVKDGDVLEMVFKQVDKLPELVE